MTLKSQKKKVIHPANNGLYEDTLVRYLQDLESEIKCIKQRNRQEP